MRKPSLFLFALSLLPLGGCATNPVSGDKDFVLMSETQEVALGRSTDAEIRKQYRIYDNPALQTYVDRIGQDVARKSHRPHLEYRFTVLDSPEINAFALPGGYIYITRGIMAYLNSEAELAAVLGHEVGHVTARHGVRQQSAAQAANIGFSIASILAPELNTQGGRDLTNLLGGALLSGYGRDHELESDRLGAQYLARTGYDPQAMIRVVGVLKNQELFDAEIARQEGREPRRYHGTFATHPDNDTRLQQVVGEAAQLTVAAPGEDRDEFLRQTAGLVFGDSVEEGLLRGNLFLHRDLGFALSLPPQWRVQNQPAQIVALHPASEAAIQLRMGAKRADSPAASARLLLGERARVESQTIGALPAAIASRDSTLLAVIHLDDKAFLLLGQARSAAAFDSQRQTMLDVIRSFRRLSVAERETLKPLRLKPITARSGDTYAGLAQRSPLGKNAENHLRLLNAHYPKGEPVAGQLIKIVE